MPHLCAGKQVDLVTMICGFPSSFQDVPSRTNVLEHDVDVGGAAPVRQHPYRVNAHKRELMRKEARYLLENDMAKLSSSPWSSPCILVPKPDGSSRLCTDYRRVNAVTVPDSFPMSRIDDCVDTIGSAKYVSKLDMLKGYIGKSL